MNDKQLFVLSMLTLAVNQAVYAATDETMLDEVVVSASKIEQKNADAPANFSVITLKK